MSAGDHLAIETTRQNSRIEFLPDRVVKSFRDDVNIEFAKALALSAIARDEGFDAPRPLELDVEARSIAFARCDGTRSIRLDYLRHLRSRSGEPVAVERCAEAGRVLAAIHARLDLPSVRQWEPPADFLDMLPRRARREIGDRLTVLPNAFLHGDYGLENIEARDESSDRRLTIFDPCPNYFVTFEADCRGPIYVDIGHFLSVIAGLVRPVEQLRAHWRNRRVLADAFLHGYAQRSGLPCDRRIALLFARGIAGAYLRRRYSRPIADFATYLTFSPHRGRFL